MLYCKQKRDQWKLNLQYCKKDSDLNEIDFEKILNEFKTVDEIKYTSEKDEIDEKTLYEYTLEGDEVTMRCKDCNDKQIYSSQLTIEIIKSIV